MEISHIHTFPQKSGRQAVGLDSHPVRVVSSKRISWERERDDRPVFCRALSLLKNITHSKWSSKPSCCRLNYSKSTLWLWHILIISSPSHPTLSAHWLGRKKPPNIQCRSSCTDSWFNHCTPLAPRDLFLFPLFAFCCKFVAPSNSGLYGWGMQT